MATRQNSGERRTSNLVVNVEPTLYDIVVVASNASGISISAWVRRAIIEELDRIDAMSKDDLMALIKGDRT